MYVLAPNQIVEIYPYSIGNLRRDNPNISFPRNPTDTVLAEWSVFRVIEKDPPEYNHITQDLTQINPTLVNGEWHQTWQITDASLEEIQTRIEDAARIARAKRDQLLSDTDWYVVQEQELSVRGSRPVNYNSPINDYRQALRDVPTQPGFPSDISWPTFPNIN